MLGILFSVLAVGQIAALSNDDFRQTFAKDCFREDGKWEPKSAVSVENFIYVVEKLEKTLEITSAAELARSLLLEFSCNRLEFKDNKWTRENIATGIYSIIGEFLENEESTLKSRMDGITTNEKCQIFFMLSQATQKDISSESERFFEHGVLSLNGDQERAVDMSKVLYGILAGFNQKIKEVKDFVPKSNDPDKLDNLYAFTIAETITLASIESKKNGGNDVTGNWTSTVCPKQYVHDNEKSLSAPSLAEIIGAVDGFLLGSKIRNIPDKNIKLSQVLRMYYTPEGFKVNSGDQGDESYCKRSNFKAVLNQIPTEELEKNIKSYMKIYVKISNNPGLENEDAAAEAIREFISSTESNLKHTEAEEEACKKNEINDICETPSDVSFILDKKSNNFTEQKTIVGALINKLNIGLDEGNISIYLNSVMGDLVPIVNPSDSKADASCTLEDYNENPGASDDIEVLNGIKNMLTVYEEDKKSLSTVPAKVVVYFNFEKEKSNREQTKQLQKAKRELQNQHPYATLIPVGSDTNYLNNYFTNERQSMAVQWDNPNLIPDLENKICEVPAAFRHRNCRIKSKITDIVYTGYIGEKRVQYFAMYPDSFLKSFDYEFQLKAENGIIRVCYSRDKPITNSEDKGCLSANKDDNIVHIQKRDPCKERTVYNCDPIFISVFGRADAESQTCHSGIGNEGEGIGCKRLDQIKYTVRHKGISCSSAKQLISTPVFQTLMTFFIVFYIITWRK